MKISVNTINKLDAIDFCEQLLRVFGEESIDMFLCDFPYTFKGKARVTANQWDLPIDDNKFFEIAMKLLKPNGCIALTATQPFASYLVMKHLDYFKYDWIWQKDNGSNFVHVAHQPFRIHESVLIFGKSPTTYNKSENYMIYNPQFTYSTPYTIKRDGSTVTNLAGFKGRSDTDNRDGKRYPKSIQQFNLERGYHPTQKPVTLFEYLIRTYTKENGIVVDVCCGSGTTAVAAKKSNRRYIVNDNGKCTKEGKFKDKDWVDVVKYRVETEIDNVEDNQKVEEKTKEQLEERFKNNVEEKTREQLEEEFRDKDYCTLCGSQRCERSGEWLDGCMHWKEFLGFKSFDSNE